MEASDLKIPITTEHLLQIHLGFFCRSLSYHFPHFLSVIRFVDYFKSACSWFSLLRSSKCSFLTHILIFERKTDYKVYKQSTRLFQAPDKDALFHVSTVSFQLASLTQGSPDVIFNLQIGSLSMFSSEVQMELSHGAVGNRKLSESIANDQV